MKVREFYFIILILCLFCSCNEDVKHKRLLMNDGKIISLVDEMIIHYESEGDLSANYGGCQLSRTMQFDMSDDVTSRQDSVYGYSSIESLDWWNIATFGDWIIDYGLEPGKEYYVQTIVEVKKQLPCYSGEQLKAGAYAGEMTKFMGYISDINRGFTISSTRDDGGYFIGTTVMTHIGYDKDGNVVDVYYPVNDLSTLKWHFVALAIDWN